MLDNLGVWLSLGRELDFQFSGHRFDPDHLHQSPYRLLARSLPFQGEERGSEPRRDTK